MASNERVASGSGDDRTGKETERDENRAEALEGEGEKTEGGQPADETGETGKGWCTVTHSY